MCACMCWYVHSSHHVKCILKQMVEIYIKAVYAVGACVNIGTFTLEQTGSKPDLESTWLKRCSEHSHIAS